VWSTPVQVVSMVQRPILSQKDVQMDLATQRQPSLRRIRRIACVFDAQWWANPTLFLGSEKRTRLMSLRRPEDGGNQFISEEVK
jgi:hypothetical protein